MDEKRLHKRVSLADFEKPKKFIGSPKTEPKPVKKRSKKYFIQKQKTKEKIRSQRKHEFISKDKWLETHKEFLRWKKTPEFQKWRHKQFLKQGGTCWYCDEPLDGARQNIEHVIPKIRGGSNKKSNLALACWRCNKDKYTDLLPYKQRQELKAKNRQKRGTYLKNAAVYSETHIALQLKEMFKED